VDILAGITIWSTAVPTAMGYAQVAGLPIQAGLYASMMALFAYAIFGTSPLLKVETSPSMAIMSALIIAPLAFGNFERYITLSAALAVTVGLLLILAGLVRMGFLADFLAKPVVVGFLFGLALVIIIGQVPSLLGLDSIKGSALLQLGGLVTALKNLSPITLAISVAAFVILWLFRRFLAGFPGTLVVIILSILAVVLFNLDDLGVAIVGKIPSGVPAPQLPNVQLSDIPVLLVGATALVFVALGESLGTARTFTAQHRSQTNTDQELIALGASNLSAGMMHGFAVGVNPASTSASKSMRAKTQIASIVTALFIVLTISTSVDIIGYLPQAVVAVAVIISASHLLRINEIKRYYQLRKLDFGLAGVAIIGVISAGILLGLLIAVFLSLLIVLYRSSQPHLAILGKIPGHVAYGDIKENPDASQIPGLLILRPEAPLFFANANVLHSQVRDLVKNSPTHITAMLIDLGASDVLDIATTDMLKNLTEDLHHAEIELLLAEVHSATRSSIERSGLLDLIGESNIYLRVPEAVDDWNNSLLVEDVD
jgi:high affinity sulfate transporter 1